jgi:agmatine/peptidylarginine deiminase
MYLWPIAPKVWIVSQYPAGSAQEESIAPALAALAFHGHTIHRVPGLEPLIYDDINTMPNYANGVIFNRLALVPAYGRKEDSVAADILRRYGFTVAPIDCSDIILSNSAIHCISTVVPE